MALRKELLTNMNAYYHLIWLDANAMDPHSSFRSKIDQMLHVFNNTQRCLEFIDTHPCQSIYLIVSGSLAKEIVPQIYDLPRIVQIYVFCGSIEAYVAWSLDYLEKVIIFSHGDDVLQRLWNDLASNLRMEAQSFAEQAKEFQERAERYQKLCG